MVLFASKFGPPEMKEWAEHTRSARHFAFFIFTLEGVSEAEIGLDKVVVSQIWEVITNFAENPNMGSKAIFESDAGMPEHLVATRKVLL